MEENTLQDADLRAALGFANNLLSQTIPPDEEQAMTGEETQQEAPVEAHKPQGGEIAPETDKEPQEDKTAVLESKFDQKLEILRTELKETIKTEIGSIRDDIKSALENDET